MEEKELNKMKFPEKEECSIIKCCGFPEGHCDIDDISKWFHQFKQMLTEVNDEELTGIKLADYIIKKWLD